MENLEIDSIPAYAPDVNPIEDPKGKNKFFNSQFFNSILNFFIILIYLRNNKHIIDYR